MTYTNSRGIKYFLHRKETIIGKNKLPTKTYFFRREKKDDYFPELPAGWTVIEARNGLPIVKKI